MDRGKRAAALKALEYVREGMTLGLGTGSTAAHFVELLGERVRAGLHIRGIPTSSRTREQAAKLGIKLTTFAETSRIDLTIDGADEIDPQLRLVKGGGGALLHEKIVAAASDEFLVIADSTKEVPALGGTMPLPVEVIPFGWQVVYRRLEPLEAHPVLRTNRAGQPFLTDEGNHILDCHFGVIPDPERTAATLLSIPGVVDHGLFLKMATFAIIGDGDRTLIRK
jgi:ribose 5-phosphate isomerase A